MKTKICSVIGCDKPSRAKGYCRKHYYNFNVHGDPCYKRTEKKCSECNKKHYAKGLCRKCWNRLTSAGTLDSKKVKDLPEEQWKEIDRIDCKNVFISNLGRVKSCRTRDERLLVSKFTKVNPHEQQFTRVCANGSGSNIIVHMEVLRAFHPNNEGDYQAVFIDGDRSNCVSSNLRWYGKEYLVIKAIAMAEASDHPLADCFLRFWHGENNVLNDWFEQQKERLKCFLFWRLDRFHVPYYIDVDDCVQETIVSAFLALRRGMIKSLDNINAWMFGVAKKVLASGVRDVLPGVSMIKEGSNGDEYNRVDYPGWCHPSAELQAIYNEEAQLTSATISQ